MVHYFKYKKLAYYDLLCDCYNRNFIEDKLKNKLKNKQVYISVIDIDNFKKINDDLGHVAGDQALKQFIDVLKQDPAINYLCRFGGDEFIIIHKEKINFELYQREFKTLTNFTFSFGTSMKTIYKSFDETLLEADKKLYINKRNRK